MSGFYVMEREVEDFYYQYYYGMDFKVESTYCDLGDIQRYQRLIKMGFKVVDFIGRTK